MNSDLQFENLIHEARMQSIRGQYTESLKTYFCIYYLFIFIVTKMLLTL